MSYKGKKTKKEKKYEQEEKEIKEKKLRISSIKKLVSRKKHSKALQEVLLYLKDYPGDSYGLFQYGSILFDIEQLEKAKEIFLRIIEEGLDSQYAAMYKMGTIAMIEDDLNQAENYFSQNIESSPYDETFSIIKLARIKSLKGYYQEGLDILEQASDQTNSKLIIEKARITSLSREFELAYEIINMYPFQSFDKKWNREAYITKANIEKNLNMYLEAKEDYKKALQGPKDATYYRALTEFASFYYSLKDYDNCFRLCKDILKECSSSVLGKINILLGDIYKELGEYHKARTKYEESTKYQFGIDKTGYFNIAKLELCRDNYKEARKYYKIIEPKNIYVKNGIQLLNLAIIEFKEKNYEKAQELLNQIDIRYVEDKYRHDYNVLKAYLDLRKTGSIVGDSYTLKQIKDYSMTRLLNHIKREHTFDLESSFFNQNIDLETLVLQVPELLKRATVQDNSICKVYQVEYPNIGIVNGKDTNILRIVMLPENNRILTMYPCGARIRKEQQNQKEVSQKSNAQIQKFYARYGKK